MLRYLLLCLFLAGMFASLITNREPQSGGGAADERRQASFAEFRSAGSENGDVSANAVALDRGDDGHFYADVEVNGQSIRFLVDTGASGIALTRDDARRAGLAASISMPEVVGEGASGAVLGEIVTLDRVSLGSTEANGVPAVVLDSGSQSLLGQSFLSKFGSVEIRGDTMVLQ